MNNLRSVLTIFTISLFLLLASDFFIGHKLLKFYSINKMTKYRIDTFFSKEPDTISWIKSFKANSVFWDIGANIGLYSVYASRISNCQTYAFEPSVYNLELLRLYAYILKNSAKRFSIIHSLDGYDEISLTGKVHVVKNDSNEILNPSDFSVKKIIMMIY